MRSERIFTGLLGVFVLTVVIVSFSYSPEARLIPLLVGIPTLLMIVFIFIAEKFYPKLLRMLNVSMLDLGKVSTKETPSGEPRSIRKGLLVISMWLVGYVILIYLAGFLIATAVLFPLFLKIMAKATWVKAIVMGAVVWGFIYGVFELFMKFELFKGMLFGEIVPSI